MDPKEACTKSNCVFEIKIDLTLVGNGTSLPQLLRHIKLLRSTSHHRQKGVVARMPKY